MFRETFELTVSLIDTQVCDKFARCWCCGHLCLIHLLVCKLFFPTYIAVMLTEPINRRGTCLMAVVLFGQHLNVLHCGVGCSPLTFISTGIASAWKHIIHIRYPASVGKWQTLMKSFVRNTTHLVSGMCQHATSHLSYVHVQACIHIYICRPGMPV